MKFTSLPSLALLFFVFSIAAAPSIQALDHLQTGRTFDSDVAIEKRYPNSKGGYQIWLTNKKLDAEALLYTTKRNAEPLFSSDMRWLLINDAEGSGSTRCKLFRRKGENGSVEFELVEDVTDGAWKFFQQETGKNPSGLHHAYVRGRCWLSSSNMVVVSLIGHGDPGHFQVNYWTCVFDPATRKFSTDLVAINAERVVD